MHIVQEISNWPHCCDKMVFFFLNEIVLSYLCPVRKLKCMPVAKTVNPSVTIRKVTCHVPSFGGGRASGWRHRPLPVWVDCMLPLYTLQLAASCVRGECVGNMKTSHLPNVLLYTIDMCAAPSAPSSKLKWDPQILHIYMNSSTRSFWHSWCSPFLLSISTGWRVP